MNEERLLAQLRDCFQGGYTLPQFCIDNGIQRPLIVAEKNFLPFMWELYVQFRYDKRLEAQFSLLDSPSTVVDYSVHTTVAPLRTLNYSKDLVSRYDKSIVLNTELNRLKQENTIYLDDLVNDFIRRTYCEIPLLQFLQRYPKVKLIVTNFPYFKANSDMTEFNEQLVNLKDIKELLLTDNDDAAKKPFEKFGYTSQEIMELTEVPSVKTNPDGSTALIAMPENNLRRIQNGKRITAYQPEQFTNTIYFVGSCHHYGINAPYYKTIESNLQWMLNQRKLPYRVENESQFFFNRYQDLFYNLNNLEPVPGDIIFVWVDNMSTSILPFIDLRNVFAELEDYRELMAIKYHVNELGYKLLARKYLDYLLENNFFRDVELNYPEPPTPPHRYGIPPQFESGSTKTFVNAELITYKKKLRAQRMPIGALVMNCNPFTLGHQYLVEYAAAQVARLYIFVVEEDKSEFPFADRIELVRAGVKHLPNVEVLPSGKFIISQQTFSGYFNKAQLQDVQVDSSEDVEIFGREIAPELGITIRFAGEEPTDNVTRQYNETMREILPRYGVEFCEIPRKKLGDEPISASSVRAALRRGDFNKIRRLVPASTLAYLQNKYSLEP